MKGNQYTRHIVKCPNCDIPMHLVNIDDELYGYRDGDQDNYYECDCGVAAYEQIRLKKSKSITYYDLDGNIMKIDKLSK